MKQTCRTNSSHAKTEEDTILTYDPIWALINFSFVYSNDQYKFARLDPLLPVVQPIYQQTGVNKGPSYHGAIATTTIIACEWVFAKLPKVAWQHGCGLLRRSGLS